MNWLAHILLSKPTTDFQLGNMLADKKKGDDWGHISDDFQAGLAAHQRIDAFTDSDARVNISKQRLGESGKLRSVVIDILYDHFLAVHWQSFCPEPLETFTANFYAATLERQALFPENIRTFLNAIARHRLLESYRQMEGVSYALHRMDMRLSPMLRQRETTAQYLDAITLHYRDLEDDFCKFFPRLETHAKQFARLD